MQIWKLKRIMNFISLQMQFNHLIIKIERWYKNRLLTKNCYSERVKWHFWFSSHVVWSKIDPKMNEIHCKATTKWYHVETHTQLVWERCRHNECEQTSKWIPKPLQISWNLHAMYTNNKRDGDLSRIWSATCNTIQNTRKYTHTESAECLGIQVFGRYWYLISWAFDSKQCAKL